MMSCAVMLMSTACLNADMSNPLSSLINFIRLSEARLQALSSKCMYSEQGLEALIRAVLAHVCQALIVVSNCIPGSPHCQVASAILRRSSRAGRVSHTSPVVTKCMDQGRFSITERIKSSVTRTELLAFWKKIEL